MANRWELKAGRTFYLDGKPAIAIDRITDANGNAVLAPWSVDKITRVIAGCLTRGKSKDRFGSFSGRGAKAGKCRITRGQNGQLKRSCGRKQSRRRSRR